eukprot:TRINITY_DN13180_c0_g2_i3.p1 TRINITY_DN13180_c0_g2~~TRINITY_DN13180_c0_g2_i3.p1  ORF type:complete len:204 (+),score=57.92 TRINITY_DN13180_c0_g2_i3:74-685(+)
MQQNLPSWVIKGVKGEQSSRQLEEALKGSFKVKERMLRLRRVVVVGEGKPALWGHTVSPFMDTREGRAISKVVMVHVCGWKGLMSLESAVKIVEGMDFPLHVAERVFVAPEAATGDCHHREDTRIIYIAMDTHADATACLGIWDASPLSVQGRSLHVHCTQLAPREYRPNNRNKIFTVPYFWKPPPLLDGELEVHDGDSSEAY